MWEGIKVLTDYKVNNPVPSEDAALPDVLNHFFALTARSRGPLLTSTYQLV